MTKPVWTGCHADNFRVGRKGFKPGYIVVHITEGGMPDGWFSMGLAQRQAAFDKAAKPGTRPIKAEVSSANYGVSKLGVRRQYVKEEDSAFHAGVTKEYAAIYKPTWKLYVPGMDVNAVSIGIEHEGYPADAWPDTQVQASAELIADSAARWDIPLDRDHVIGHHEIYAGHSCPGQNCPIDRLIALAKGTKNA